MHKIRVLIAPPATAERAVPHTEAARGFQGRNGWVVIRLSPALLEQLAGRKVPVPDLEDAEAERLFSEYCEAFVPGLLAIVPDLTGVLAATQYWGGAGAQAAAALSSGAYVCAPSVSEGAIHRALVSLGCPLLSGLDAFDSVGLGQWRKMDAFGAGSSR